MVRNVCCGAVSEGDIVKVSANGHGGQVHGGHGFCGVVRAVAHDGKACTVQLGGLASVKYSGTAPAVGFSELVADGSGGVSKPGENQNGSSYLVLSVDSAANKAVIKL